MVQMTDNQYRLGFPMNPRRKHCYNPVNKGKAEAKD